MKEMEFFGVTDANQSNFYLTRDGAFQLNGDIFDYK